MAFEVGTHISFKKVEPLTFLAVDTTYWPGSRVRFLNWLAPAGLSAPTFA